MDPAVETISRKRFDLEERTYQFARDCRDFVLRLPRTITNTEYGRQLTRSSGSQAANYIEANESLTKKDFTHRIMLCRKETKESILWLRLCTVANNTNLQHEQTRLIDEGTQLMRIFGSIVVKSR